MMPRGIENRFRVARDYLGKRPAAQGFPLELQLGITNCCNLDCEFCPQKKSPRPRGEMPIELLEDLLGQAAPFVDTVDLSYDGEPFLHRDWPGCLQACTRRGVRAMFETNCLLLDESRAREVLDLSPGSITLSIDAAREETYRKLKPSGDFGRVVSNAERFLALARSRKRRPYIQVQFVLCDQNRAEAGEFLRYWKGKGADAVHIKPLLNFAGSVGAPPAAPALRPCLFLWTSLAVSWDGVVPLCCLEIEGRTRMGDANSSSLGEIFRGESFRAARLLHASGRYREHQVCRDCSVPSVAWPFVLGAAFTGDLFRRKLINKLSRVFPL